MTTAGNASAGERLSHGGEPVARLEDDAARAGDHVAGQLARPLERGERAGHRSVTGRRGADLGRLPHQRGQSLRALQKSADAIHRGVEDRLHVVTDPPFDLRLKTAMRPKTGGAEHEQRGGPRQRRLQSTPLAGRRATLRPERAPGEDVDRIVRQRAPDHRSEAGRATRGSTIRNVVPTPTLLSTRIVPPARLTIP